MKVLLTRFGGIGDCFPVGAVAKYLANQGNDVTVALRDDGSKVKQSNLFREQTDFKVIDFKQIGPWGDRCVKTDLGWLQIQATYGKYDSVVDFMNVVENNSTSPLNNNEDLWEFWQRSRSSNYQNWYDLHYAWCGINPQTVHDLDKRPSLIMAPEEIVVRNNFKQKVGKLFVIHPFASSLARSWYQAKDLIPKLLNEYPGCTIAFWNPNDSAWDLVSSKAQSRMPKLSEDPLRQTMMLISVSDLVVTVDTGCSHIAEGLDKKALVIYSTVPAWTRNKYYKYQYYIDPGEKNPDFYTFSLSLGDPLRVKEGLSSLTERELLVKSLFEKNVSEQEAMDVLNTDARGAELELKALMAKKETWERQQSKALSSVSVDTVFERIKQIME